MVSLPRVRRRSNKYKMAVVSALSKFQGLFGRRSSVIIGMIHVEALPGNVRYMMFWRASFFFMTFRLTLSVVFNVTADWKSLFLVNENLI